MLLEVQLKQISKLWSWVNRPWRRVLYITLTFFAATAVFLTKFRNDINGSSDQLRLQFPDTVSSLKSPADIFRLDRGSTSQAHPITHLINDADGQLKQLLKKETFGVSKAAQAYRKRRGRHPPPRFDQWVEFAETHGCLMIEEFFDRIYHDLEPFWAIPSQDIRADSAAWPTFIRVRDGVAHRSENEQPFMESYFDLVQKIAQFLPDLDMPINHMDESRVLVPWQDINRYMEVVQSAKRRQDLTKPPQSEQYTSILGEKAAERPFNLVTEGSYWDFTRRTCRPDSEALKLEIDKDFSTPPVFPKTHPYGTYSGFVKNWTVSQDVCNHPHLRNIHGTFVEPISISSTFSLLPIFSGSKLLGNNDILLPPAMYWANEERFAASKEHIDWNKKKNEVFWRGTGSGGRNKVENWTRFHRHRLVSLLNGTQVEMTLEANRGSGKHPNGSESVPHNFPLPDQALYPLVSAKLGLLADWIRSFSNVAFYWLECFPATKEFGCSYTGSWYRQGSTVPMQRMFLNKYLPDVDGNSFSGRFRAFMLSNSLPIKATLYTEWHDSRLIPWKHFVPVDNTFMDMLSVLEFLFQHDDQAEKIAVEGRKWTERVLRKEDMLVYVYRLLLEYARVSDPNRENLGFGQDLK